MATALQLILWITFVSTSAYKCNEEGCSINNSDDVRNFENHHRSQHLVSESPRMVERTASYSVVSKFPRVKTSSKLEDGTRKENGSYKILNENRRFYPKTDVRIGGQTEDKIVFPGLTSDRPQFVPIISEECKRTGICEDVPNYPLDKIGNIIASEPEIPDSVEENIFIESRVGYSDIKVKALMIPEVDRSRATIQEFIPKIPKECEREIICSKILNFPKDDLETFYSLHGTELEKFFGNSSEFLSSDDTEFNERQGASAGEFLFCNITKKYIVANLTMKDVTGTRRMIALPENITIPTIQCTNIDVEEVEKELSQQECKAKFAEITYDDNYSGKCIQRTMDFRLPIFVNPTSYQIHTFKVPTSCECVVISTSADYT